MATPGAREPAVAGLFYPADPRACRRAVERCLAAASVPPSLRAVAAIAPHAGWDYSGVPLAAALLALPAEPPDTVLLFGADHHGRAGGRASVYPRGSWTGPLGAIEVDAEVAAAVPAVPSAEAHAPEHSLEVLVPFVQVRWPRARIVPVLVPPGVSVGEATARAALAAGRRAVAIGSSDLTHYGERYGCVTRGTGAAAHRWSKEENDREILDRALALDAPGILASFRRRRNACGPGAMAATVDAARVLGATRAVLLEHTTSAEVLGEPEPYTWVGYAAVAYCK